jgi:hypothetical protein
MGTVYADLRDRESDPVPAARPGAHARGVLFGVIYAVVAIGASWGAVRVLSQRRAALT